MSKLTPASVAVLAALASVAAVRLLYPNVDPLNIYPLNPASPPRAPVHRGVVDLSAVYGRVNKTIFNKRTHVVFSKPQEFFSDSGVGSFQNLKFDDRRRLPPDLRLVTGRSLTHEEIAAIEDGP